MLPLCLVNASLHLRVLALERDKHYPGLKSRHEKTLNQNLTQKAFLYELPSSELRLSYLCR